MKRLTYYVEKRPTYERYVNKGYAVVIPGFEEWSFGVGHVIDHDGGLNIGRWVTTELSTGASIGASATTRGGAVNSATAKLFGVGVEKMRSAVEEYKHERAIYFLEK